MTADVPTVFDDAHVADVAINDSATTSAFATAVVAVQAVFAGVSGRAVDAVISE